VGDSIHVLRLWFLGVVWAYGSWLVVVLALGGGVLVFAWLDRLAAVAESARIQEGWRGVPGLLRNRLAISSLVSILKVATAGAVALAGLATMSLQGFVEERLQEEPARARSDELPFAKEMSLDFILLGGIVVMAMTLVSCGLAWQALRGRAAVWESPGAKTGRPSTIVRLYHRSRFASALLLILGSYLVFGLLMQLFYLLALLLPLPAWLLTVSIPGTALMGGAVITLLWLGMVFVLVAPFSRLWLRSLNLWLRGIAENRIALASWKFTVAGLAFFLGLACDIWLLETLGAACFPLWFP
jgi:hypothetical protein